MKPARVNIIVASMSLIAMITACSGGNTAAPSEEKTATAAATNQEANVVENSDGLICFLRNDKNMDMFSDSYPRTGKEYVHQLIVSSGIETVVLLTNN